MERIASCVATFVLVLTLGFVWTGSAGAKDLPKEAIKVFVVYTDRTPPITSASEVVPVGSGKPYAAFGGEPFHSQHAVRAADLSDSQRVQAVKDVTGAFSKKSLQIVASRESAVVLVEIWAEESIPNSCVLGEPYVYLPPNPLNPTLAPPRRCDELWVYHSTHPELKGRILIGDAAYGEAGLGDICHNTCRWGTPARKLGHHIDEWVNAHYNRLLAWRSAKREPGRAKHEEQVSELSRSQGSQLPGPSIPPDLQVPPPVPGR